MRVSNGDTLAYVHQEFPKWLYHQTLAPNGKIFQSVAETQGLDEQGWVDSPAKFPKALHRDVAELQKEFEAAEEQLRFWTSDGRTTPQSSKWHEVTTRYNLAKDLLDFALREKASKVQPQDPVNSSLGGNLVFISCGQFPSGAGH